MLNETLQKVLGVFWGFRLRWHRGIIAESLALRFECSNFKKQIVCTYIRTERVQSLQ